MLYVSAVMRYAAPSTADHDLHLTNGGSLLQLTEHNKVDQTMAVFLLILTLHLLGSTAAGTATHTRPDAAMSERALRGQVLTERSPKLSEQFAIQQLNYVDYNGMRYSTLADVPVTDYTSQCQNYYLPVPSGWSIAPDDIYSQAVISLYPWSTDVLVVADGNSYGTAQFYPGLSWNDNMLQESGGYYAVVYCTLQILIFQEIPVSSGSSSKASASVNAGAISGGTLGGFIFGACVMGTIVYCLLQRSSMRSGDVYAQPATGASVQPTPPAKDDGIQMQAVTYGSVVPAVGYAPVPQYGAQPIAGVAVSYGAPPPALTGGQPIAQDVQSQGLVDADVKVVNV
jgi:hypothetical protein